jgi:6-phosphogluconolactonase (cycloisomerase 2 family)
MRLFAINMLFVRRAVPANQLRTFAKLLAVVALSLALASCGTNTPFVCDAPIPSSGTCVCSSGTAACPISPGPEFLYATGSGQILAFSIDHNSGALATIGSVAGPSMTFGLTAVNNQFLYASDASNAQLDGFSIDQTTGALALLANSPFSTGTISLPQGLASPLGSDILYAADVGGVDAFSVSTAGVPTALSESPFPSGTNLFLAVDPSGKFLYTSLDNPPGSVFGFTIDSTGSLTAVPNSPFTIPGQTIPNSRPFGIVDTGSYVYAALSGTNQIAAFSIVSGTGALTPVLNSPFLTGATPITLVSASGFLYALNDGGIFGYSVNSSTGVLTPLSDSPFAIVGSSMAADYFGEYLYVAGLTGIQAFSIDSTSGTLIPVVSLPVSASGIVTMTAVQIPPP